MNDTFTFILSGRLAVDRIYDLYTDYHNQVDWYSILCLQEGIFTSH